MLQQTQKKIFSSLKISKDQLLNEVAVLLVKQQLSEYLMEIEYLENKYNKNFEKFDHDFRNQKASYEMENDWMKWKFAEENIKESQPMKLEIVMEYISSQIREMTY